MKYLRYLVYFNPLVVDKISKKFLFWKDSGFIFTKNLVQSLPKESRFYLLIPDKIKDEKELDWFREFNDHVQLIPYPYSTNMHQNRYEYYGNVLRKAFPYTMDIDVIINNQPEVAKNLRVWADNQRRDKPVIASFYHWIDCERSRKFAPSLGGYFWRQYEGAISSDIAYFHGDYAKDLFVNEIRNNIRNPDEFTIWYFNPPPTIFAPEEFELPKKKIILFNHRLNNTTNWSEVLDISKSLYEDQQDFVVWFTDDQNLKRKEEIEQLPFIIVKSLNDGHYGHLLRNSHFSVCNHKGYSTWNMAVLDSIKNGCFPLVPGDCDDVYYWMFSEIGNELGMFHDGKEDLKSKMKSHINLPIEYLKDKNDKVENSIHKFCNPLSFVERDIYGEIKRRVPNNEPAKYSDVKEFIKFKGRSYKKEFVNYFWSFHVNSNFQKIRWKLLNQGFKDNVSQAETEYYI